ncbi:MAG: hypothetical protein P8J55_06225 [Pseudomonadales bacterium]|nr:hypothetical protein [Pseudomonadales bacterium]
MASAVSSSKMVRVRTIVVTLLPAFIISLMVTWLTLGQANSTLLREGSRFGNTIADQLAITATDYLVNQDALSLNIMLRNLLNQGDIAHVAVYDAEYNLIAQAGKRSTAHRIFTRDITSHSTLMGHLRLGLRSDKMSFVGVIIKASALFFLLSLGFASLIWFYGDVFFVWLTGPEEEHSVAEAQKAEAACWLVIKIKPGRLIDDHREKLAEACRLYNGEQQSRGDDIIVTFNTGEHIQSSICCALLIKAITDLLPGNINFKAGLDIGEDEEVARKHAAYLAGISDQQVLVSVRVFMQHKELQGQNVLLSELQHSLIGDGEVYTAESSNSLIEHQAAHLCAN